MADENGFKDMADFLGRIASVDPVKVSKESLTDAANFYMEKLIPVIPQSLLKRRHMKEQVKVVVEDTKVKVVFEDTAYYWRFPENGTPKQRAQHFASGTYQKYRSQIEDIMTQKITDTWKG